MAYELVNRYKELIALVFGLVFDQGETQRLNVSRRVFMRVITVISCTKV
jgi:hypothetical protein